MKRKIEIFTAGCPSMYIELKVSNLLLLIRNKRERGKGTIVTRGAGKQYLSSFACPEKERNQQEGGQGQQAYL